MFGRKKKDTNKEINVEVDLSTTKVDIDVDSVKSRIHPTNSNLNADYGMVITDFLVSKREHDPELFGGTDVIRYGVMELLLNEIKKKNIPGQMAELGVYRGITSRFINTIIPDKTLYLFDTFEGFDKRDMDIQSEEDLYLTTDNRQVEFSDTTVEEVLRIMPHPESCVIKKGYFPQSLNGLNEAFCFISLDCDLYAPTLEGLEYFYPRLSKGGYIMVHDYNNVQYEKGIKKAVDDYCTSRGIPIIPIPDAWGSVVIAK